jgi:hypothetical protein
MMSEPPPITLMRIKGARPLAQHAQRPRQHFDLQAPRILERDLAVGFDQQRCRRLEHHALRAPSFSRGSPACAPRRIFGTSPRIASRPTPSAISRSSSPSSAQACGQTWKEPPKARPFITAVIAVVCAKASPSSSCRRTSSFG